MIRNQLGKAWFVMQRKKYASRRQNWRVLPLLAALLALPARLPAAELGDRELAKVLAQAQLSQQNLEEAIAILQEHLSADPSDYESWNLLGLLQLKWRDNPSAAHSFANAMKSPHEDNKLVYKYNYADASIRAGKINDAERALKDFSRYRLYQGAAASALRTLEPGKALPPLDASLPALATSQKSWSGMFFASYGYDTNVPVASFIEQNLRGRTASPNAKAGLTLRWTLDRESRFQLQALGAATYQSLPALQSLNNTYGRITTLWRQSRPTGSFVPGQFVSEVSNTVDIVRFGFSQPQTFNWNDTLTWSLDWGLNPTTALGPTLAVRYQKFFDDPSLLANTDRSGFAFSPGLHHIRLERSRTIHSSVHFEYLAAHDPFWITNGAFASVAIEQSFFGQTSGTASARLSLLGYPNATRPRRDEQITASCGINQLLGKGLNISLQYQYIRNSSNFELAQYSKHLATAVLGYAF
jgi:Tfp pilus assembly protein PilF